MQFSVGAMLIYVKLLPRGAISRITLMYEMGPIASIFATSALASAIHSTGHYHVRLGPVCLAASCARIAYDRRNRGSSGGLSSID